MNQIRLEKWTTSKDAKGNNTELIQSKVNAWAEITRSGGDRSSINGKAGLTNFYIFKLRFNPKIDPTGNWRVIYNGKRLTVHSIEQEKEQRFFWIIKAESVGKN